MNRKKHVSHTYVHYTAMTMYAPRGRMLYTRGNRVTSLDIETQLIAIRSVEQTSQTTSPFKQNLRQDYLSITRNDENISFHETKPDRRFMFVACGFFVCHPPQPHRFRTQGDALWLEVSHVQNNTHSFYPSLTNIVFSPTMHRLNCSCRPKPKVSNYPTRA